MKIALGCDHGGFGLKATVLALLRELGHTVEDCGVMAGETADYPNIAADVCSRVASGAAERGILLCGTGIGVAIAANRNPVIRAALCSESFSARMSREHNDANVLCLGGRTLGPGLAEEIVRIWLSTQFVGGRHVQRIALLQE
ncbi:MAG: ribose 5-phosphate isomerase B [Desulfobulbaceae bacterium]|nr:MAG: ribose 5-phosphate isomerase B [Desulfobulbaceae bacterium]